MKVYIEVTESVTYCTEVEMIKEEFDAYETALDSDTGRDVTRTTEQIVGRYIDRSQDYLDSGNPEMQGFYAVDEDQA